VVTYTALLRIDVKIVFFFGVILYFITTHAQFKFTYDLLHFIIHVVMIAIVYKQLTLFFVVVVVVVAVSVLLFIYKYSILLLLLS